MLAAAEARAARDADMRALHRAITFSVAREGLAVALAIHVAARATRVNGEYARLVAEGPTINLSGPKRAMIFVTMSVGGESWRHIKN